MFDFAWSEFALIGMVALLVIGPKDMPTAIRAITRVVKKARGLAAEFQGHVDEMVREADLGDVRQHVRDLRNLDVRGRIMRAVDGDGSVRRAFDDPLKGHAVKTGPQGAIAGDAAGGAALAGSASSGASHVDAAALPYPGAEPFSYNPTVQTVGTPSAYAVPAHPGEATAGAPLMAAPSILPPMIARRVSSERRRLLKPSILPPVRVLHGDRRIAPLTSLPRAEPDPNAGPPSETPFERDEVTSDPITPTAHDGL